MKNILKTIALLLPAIIPSWRFFDRVAASPRIEFALLRSAHDTASDWQEFRPRPAHISIGTMLKRLLWNARWNESLFLVSCAERLMEDPTEHSAQEIVMRIKAELARCSITIPYIRFRLLFLHREEYALQKHIAFVSPSYRCSEVVAS